MLRPLRLTFSLEKKNKCPKIVSKYWFLKKYLSSSPGEVGLLSGVGDLKKENVWMVLIKLKKICYLAPILLTRSLLLCTQAGTPPPRPRPAWGPAAELQRLKKYLKKHYKCEEML